MQNGPIKRLKYVKNLVLYSCIHLAAGGVLLSRAFASYMGINYPPLVDLSVFCMIFTAYSINRKSDIEEDDVNREFGSRKLAERVYYLGVGSLATGVTAAALAGPLVLAPVLLFAAVLVIYSVKLLPKSFRFRRLKEVPFVKNLSVAAAYSMLVVFSMMAYSSVYWREAALVFWSLLGINVFISTVIPDIRDIEGDRAAGIRTLPVILGGSKSRKLLLGVNTLGLIILAASIHTGTLLITAGVLFLSQMLEYAIIWLSKQERADKMNLASEINILYLFPMLLLISGMI